MLSVQLGFRATDFEPPEHVLRTLARAHTCTMFSPGLPACPTTECKTKDPRAERQKCRCSQKVHIIHSNTRLPFGEWNVSRGVTQAGMRQGKVINRHPAVLVAWSFLKNATFRDKLALGHLFFKTRFLVTNRDAVLS